MPDDAVQSDSHLGDELDEPDIDERRRAAEDRVEPDTQGPDMPVDDPEPRPVEDARARVLLEGLLFLARQCNSNECGLRRFEPKLSDKHEHFEMIQRWTSPPPDEWLSAFLRWKMFAKLRVMMGEISQEATQAQLRFIDDEFRWLREHWTRSGSFLKGSVRAYAELARIQTEPQEHPRFLPCPVANMRLTMFVLSMSLIEWSMVDAAKKAEWAEDTARQMPGGEWPADLSRLLSSPEVEVDEHGRAYQ